MFKLIISMLGAIIIAAWIFTAASARSKMSGTSDINSDETIFTGEISVQVLGTHGNDESAEFDQYNDLSQPITGDANLSYLHPDRYHLQFKGNRLGADDRYIEFLGDWYGKISTDIVSDRISHKFADDAVTLYTGIGSGHLGINNQIQDSLSSLGQDDLVAGRMALSPENKYQYFNLSAGYTALPFNSRITAALSLGRMTQSEDLTPYTVNNALTTPFDATDPVNLPQANVDAKVDTALYYLKLISNPTKKLRITGNFRYFEYDNDTEQVRFPGYVNNDDFFNPTEISNSPVSYRHLTAGTEGSWKLTPRTQFSLGYRFDRTRRTNSPVDSQDDHTVKVGMEAFYRDWADIRLSYQKQYRTVGSYDESSGPSTQLPQLRKYNMADRVQDQIGLQTTFYPTDSLVLGGAVTYSKNEFNKSPFGLQHDENFTLSIDADWAISEKTSIYGSFIHERYQADQKASDDILDPSPSLWSAKISDIFNTVTGGIKISIIPQRLDADLSYAYTVSNGKIDLTGNTESPIDFSNSDDAVQHTLHTKINYHIKNGISLTLGYLWKKLDYEDFNIDGFSPVSANSSNTSGATLVEGLFMGTLPEDYDAHVLYAKITYRF
ncbi:MtrB/PioB family outer membrane beta-barrel protein [Thermodesulfobacteriota bacterium]